MMSLRFAINKLLFAHSGLDPWFDRLTTLSKVEGESSSCLTLYNTGCRIRHPEPDPEPA
ncbi:MAG: hypothetical protein V2I56_05535 [Desulfobacteraceae bacterium]|jgi:hypothetical protein|nr:hypothetical protein [Desulfobacteraceae bacterium]